MGKSGVQGNGRKKTSLRKKKKKNKECRTSERKGPEHGGSKEGEGFVEDAEFAKKPQSTSL